jgi:DNA helicase-2/ATP-dependent DNA helicase PcrA
MTKRTGQPDTEADRKLRACLDAQPLTHFVMVAGAGSGKTTSLVKALDHLARTKGDRLRRRGQQIACITYTEVAVKEIWGDVGNAPLFHVSTIHSFLWTVVRSFQEDIRKWVHGRINEKIAEAQAHQAKPRMQAATKERLARDIERYRAQLAGLSEVKRFSYGTGSDYAKGILGHDDILKIGPALIAEYPLLSTIMARRFPYIFVDESQDTDPAFVSALKHVAKNVEGGFCLGFFGDPMQKIYTTGAGSIELEENWLEITKPENFRCPARVLQVINRIRADGDGLQQTRGRMIKRDGQLELVQGSARLFIAPADDRRVERLQEIRQWLAQTNSDPLWESDDADGDVRALVLVHRMAARRLGFANLYAALQDNGDNSLKDGLVDGTAWVLRPFMKYLLALAHSARNGVDFEVIAALRRECPLLEKERVNGQDVASLLTRLQRDVNRFVELLSDDGNHTIAEVLAHVHGEELAALDERLIGFLAGPDVDREENAEAAAVQAFLATPAKQLWAYRAYIEEQSPFDTQQGIKGAEFQRVLVILDDEEGRHSHFSYGKYFGIEELSKTDKENISKGIDSAIERTRRLFYVCCSRAVQDLAVVFFVPDVDAARKAAVATGFFPEDDIHVFEKQDDIEA